MEHSDATILPIESVDATLADVGGKALSLARLSASGLPVPDGFLLGTNAYRRFVAENDLQSTLLEIVGQAAPDDAVSIELAAARIQSVFAGASTPDEVEAFIAQGYSSLGDTDKRVAVRSSATAEDLPGLSFAGQQDSYLNVRGVKAVTQAVRRCWASLWNARAIAYRLKMDIDQQRIAMGVVVQIMVPAEVSGILFTANPTSGERSEVVVNASYGLGEAIVGGQVTPDTFIVDRNNNLAVKDSVVGPKEEMIIANGDQGTMTQAVAEASRQEVSLPNTNLRELVELSLQVESLFDGEPQDIEWALAEGKLWLLQSRPITNLPAAPLTDVSWDPPTKKTKLIRRQVVENMPDPLSPLFEQLYLTEGLDESIDEVLEYFGMPMKVEYFVERPLFLTVNAYAYCRANYRFNWRMLVAMPRLILWYIRALPKLLREVVPRWRDERLPHYLATIEPWRAIDPTTTSDEQLLSGIRQLTVADACHWFDVSMVLGAAKITDGLFNRFLTSWLVPGELTSGVFLRGFPSKTLDAQQELERIATDILAADALRKLVNETAAADLLDALKRHADGQAVVESVDKYLDQHGHQIYTLDFAEPTQVENPLPILMNLKRIVQDGGSDTAALQAKMIREREEDIRRTLKSLAPTRRWLFQKLLGWAQLYGPYREEVMFYVGTAWPTLRRLARELGERLVQLGTLNMWDDVFYLETDEIKQAYTARSEGRSCPQLANQAEQRRALREARKKLHPPGMIPVGSRLKIGWMDLSFFETQKRNDDTADVLSGFAVSPGKITGTASVVHSPADFENMEPDTILVCPTTTPAWTPLFARAIALVTDIGGILAHGSIVAREYGIPAVLGTGNGTQRIVSGQKITVDGDAGEVTILE